MPQQTGQKILRLGVIQNGRVIEERLFRERKPVSAGRAFRNEIVLPAPDAPESFRLFDVQDGRYYLRFSKDVDGRLLSGKSSASLHELLAKKKAVADRKGGYRLPLPDDARGKVRLGEATVLFQFVSAPPLRVLPQLPAEMRGSLLYFVGSVLGLQGFFLASLLFSLALQGGFAAYAATRPAPPRPFDLSALPERQVQAMLMEDEEEEVEPDEPDEEETEDGDEPGEADSEPDPEPEPEPEATPERPPEEPVAAPTPRDQERERIRSLLQAEREGMVDQISATAERSELTAAELAEQAGQVRDDESAQASDVFGSDRRGPTDVDVDGDGPGGVDIGESRRPAASDEPPPPSPDIAVGDVDTPMGGDPRRIRQQIGRRSRAFEECYQVQLNENPSLSGRVVIRFVIQPDGTYAASIQSNTTGSAALAECIERQAARGIRFGRQENLIQVDYPLTLRPGT